MSDRRVKVVFAAARVRDAFEALESGRFEDRQLAGYIRRAISDLEANPAAGTLIPQRLWPKEYVRQYGIKHLRKYDLPNGWRLIYSLKGTEVEILVIILEWFSHKDYEKRFGYKVG